MPFEADFFLIYYIIAGAFAGISAGMLGIGGGLIIVPILASLFAYQNMHTDIIMHMALGTSLATIVFTSISSIRSHQQHRAILWPLCKILTPGILLGACLGGWLASQMNTSILKPIFAVFELLVALHMIRATAIHSHRHLTNTTLMNVGGIIGTLSTLLGIGGGTMSVPFLVYHGINMRHAIATSAAIGLPIALAGSLSYVVSGWQNQQLPDASLGYVHIPSLLGIVISSVLFAPVGAALAHKLPINQLKKIFALLLVLMAGKLLFSEF